MWKYLIRPAGQGHRLADNLDVAVKTKDFSEAAPSLD
jgi:hypothetical protein